MERRIEERVDSWESRRFTDGYDELRDLASAEFSGAIDVTGTQVFMLNGRIIGVLGGQIEDLEHAEGMVYRAPHPSVALLYTMQQKGGETRAQYYTEETPLQEVDSTLSEGSFTGYIELSENVLSGDYYFVYYGGKAMHAAYVGTNDRLITDEEAYEQAVDEVGIYEVVDVDIEITEIPSEDGGATEAQDEPAATKETHQPSDDAQPASEVDPPADQHGGTDRETQQTEGQQRQPRDRRQPSNGRQQPPDDRQRVDQQRADEQPSQTDQQRRTDQQRGHSPEGSATEPRPTDDQRAPETTPESHRGDATQPSNDRSGRQPSDGRTDQQPPTDGADPGRVDRQETRGHDAPSDGASRDQPDVGEQSRGADPRGDGVPETPEYSQEAGAGTRSSPDDAGSTPFDEEAAWREADTIPSLDPDKTASPGGSDVGTTGASERNSIEQARDDRSERAAGVSGDTDVEDAFDEEVLQREDQIDVLNQKVANLQAERDDLRRERDELSETVDQLREENATLEDELDLLQDEIERLERELEQGNAGSGGQAGGADTGTQLAAGGQQLSKADALSGTDLFVRYDSKSEPTLEDAHAGDADPKAVNANLRLEQHTRFEAAEVTVEGRPYATFLEETLEYRVVEWFVTQLPYEIRDTGHVAALQDLYDAYPEIDRAELDGDVSIQYTEDGEEIREQVTFDVVIRDRMGNPLVVANINDRRDPASEEMMVELNEDAMRVKETSDSLGAAILVTESFFSPGALETAAEATGGSFLSRDSRESFVKLSRKRGYHLCLIEARDEDFHLNEPEL